MISDQAQVSAAEPKRETYVAASSGDQTASDDLHRAQKAGVIL